MFHREIDAGDDLIEVVRSEGAPHVSVYTGPFVWQIEVPDLQPVIALLGRATAEPGKALPPLLLTGGKQLHVGFGAETGHVWISAGQVHMRIETDVAALLVAALSEARAHITRKLEEHRATLLAEGVQPTC